MPNTVAMNDDYPVITRSDALYARSQGLVPAHCQTLAKGPGQYVDGVAPKYLERGKGSHVWDVDGNEYIDLNMGIGPISLGYRYERVDAAVRAQLEKGISFSLVCPLEVEVAELMRAVVPGADMVRFSKTGCDVTSAAVRLARAYTGRDKVLCCGYHGWHDWFVSVTDRDAGIPVGTRALVHTFEFNDLDHLARSISEDTACVIMEPVVFAAPEPGYHARVKELCARHGTLLIFDEMWTGFRLALGGAQEYFGTTADIAVFSKAVANGMPISMITGRADVMEKLQKEVFFFTTFGGEALSLAAAKATIEEMRDRDVPAVLFRQGRKLREGYNQAAVDAGVAGYTQCIGLDCRTVVTFDSAAGPPLILKSFVQQEMIKRGVLWSGFHNMCLSHSDRDIAHVLAAYREVLPLLKDAVDARDVEHRLRGAPVEPAFGRIENFNTKPRSPAG